MSAAGAKGTVHRSAFPMGRIGKKYVPAGKSLPARKRLRYAHAEHCFTLAAQLVEEASGGGGAPPDCDQHRSIRRSKT